MKKFLFFILIPLFTLFPEELKISFIDMERVLKEYAGVSEAKAELDRMVKEWEDELIIKKKETDSLKVLYEKEKPSLSEEAKLERERQIKEKEEDYRRFLEEIWGKNGKLKETTKKLIEPHVAKIQKTVEKTAKDMGYDLVIDISKDVVMYSSQKVDITDLVIEELNREYQGITTPGVLRKLKVCVLPFYEKSEAMRTAQWGEIFRGALRSAISKYGRLELISEGEIFASMDRRGIDESKITVDDVKQIILEFVADYAVFGRLEMEGKEIRIYADLLDSKGNVIESYTDSSPDEENPLKEAGYRIAQQIIEKLKK